MHCSIKQNILQNLSPKKGVEILTGDTVAMNWLKKSRKYQQNQLVLHLCNFLLLT